MRTVTTSIIKLYVIFIILCGSLMVNAQTDKGASVVEGYVIDDATGDILPFVNVYFQNTSIGTSTDLDGKYKIKARNHNDTLIFSMIGFHEVKAYVVPGKKYRLIIRLKEDSQTLNEVVITPDENPAHIILRNILKNKRKNNPEKFSEFNCQTYTVLSAKFSNVTKDNLKFLIPKAFVKQLPITMDSTGRPVLPFYLSEKISDNYINRDEHISQTKQLYKNVKAIVGLDDMDIEGYDNSLSAEMNFYKNFVELLGHTFVSPLATNGLAFYKYYLQDSTVTDKHTFYHIKFVARHKKDLAFTGHFIVVKDLWAITSIKAILPRSANINYINSFKIGFDYDFVNDSTLFFKSNSIYGTFHYLKIKNEAENAMIELNKKTYYSNIRLGRNAHPLSDTITEGTVNITTKEADSSFVAYRELASLESFENTSKIIDSTNNIWWVKGAEKITNMFVTGYYNLGKVDFGPYLGTFSRNKIEGVRLNLGLRTSETFNPYYSLGGGIGYGFKDMEWKYSLYGQYKFKTKRRTLVGAGFVKNLYLFGVYSHIKLIKENMLATGEDSFIAAVLKRYHSDRRAMLYRYNIYFEKEWRRGFMTNIEYEYDELREGLYVPFIHDGQNVDYVYNNAVSLRVRFSWKEKIMDINLRRYYLRTFYPVINVVGTGGIYSVAGNDGKYFKLHITLKHKVPVGFMRFNYVFETGYIFGKVPFPLLEIIRGNDTYGDSKYRFNLLNNATAALDKYASVMAEHHFNGLITNKIPLIRALNVRTVISAKYFLGTLSDKHEEVLEYPWDMDVPGNHYLELGAGLENIFQIFRIEFIWRPVPEVYAGMPKYGVRIRADFNM
ncbi:MAG: DUF5686 family protein [Bacteroidota bacterium]